MTRKIRFQAMLALALSGAFVSLAAWNWMDRIQFQPYYDGVVWENAAAGPAAVGVRDELFKTPSGEGIRVGDSLVAIDGISVASMDDYVEVIERYLEAQAEGQPVEYVVHRGPEQLEITLLGAVTRRPQLEASHFALALLAVLYMGIGSLIYLRSWQAEHAFHFFLMCLSAFALFSLSPSAQATPFDLWVYWVDSVAFLLLPALLLHFCCVFPKPLKVLERLPRFRSLFYVPFGTLFLLQAFWFIGGLQPFGFPRNQDAQLILDRMVLTYFVAFLAAGGLVLLRLQWGAARVLQRQQLKWISWSALAGTLPVLLLLALPVAFGAEATSGMELSLLSLGLIPMGFAYAITKHRLLDVDLVFREGIGYALTSSALLGAYVGVVLLASRLVQAFYPEAGFLIFAVAALVLGFLFAPVKERVQTQIDRFFYKDQYQFRRSFSEFGRNLGSEIHLSRLLDRITRGVEAALNASPVAVFLRQPGEEGFFETVSYSGLGGYSLQDLRFPNEWCESPRPIRLGSEATFPQAQEALGRLGLRYFQALRVRGRVIGFLGLGRRDENRLLDNEDLDLVSTLADYAAIAIDNALLYGSLEAKAGQLSRLRAFSENVVESIAIGVAVVEPEGLVRVWNGGMEMLFDISKDQAVGRRVDEVLPASLIEVLDRMREGDLWAASQVKSIFKVPVEGLASRRLVNVSMSPFLDEAGRGEGVLVLFEDVTDKARLENQLQQAEKLSSIGLFAAGVAHEVNTPLAGISSYAQMLLQGRRQEDPDFETLKKIEKQSFRASQIVNNLLNFARVSESEAQEVNLNSLMVETVSLLEHQFKRSAVDVRLDLDPYLPSTLGVSGKLQQVFMNLFMNARDAMPKGGRLDVKTYGRDSEAVIEVRDTGSGIAQEHLHRIFDPFFTTKEVGKGTGLGLAVSYGIVQEHAGHIDVESQAGGGTTFRIRLPFKRVN